MTEPRYKAEELEVIGFADSLNESFVPRMVRPIFRVRNEPECVLIPPFEFEGDWVLGAIPGRQTDLDRAIRQGQATRLESAIPARSDHELWIDEELEPHYGASDVVLDELQRKAHDMARGAQRFVVQGRLDEAERLAQAAISADDGCLNAILVKAIIDRIQGHEDSLEVLVQVAETIVPGADFRTWIDFYSDLTRERDHPESQPEVGATVQSKEGIRASMRELLFDIDPNAFDHMIQLLLDAMGYVDTEVTSPSNDKGVDVVGKIKVGITEVREVVQVKRIRTNVQRPALDQLRGSLYRFNAVRGTIINTGGFSKGARDAAFDRGAAPITLIDGEALVELLIDNGIGVRKSQLEVWELDSEAFNMNTPKKVLSLR